MAGMFQVEVNQPLNACGNWEGCIVLCDAPMFTIMRNFCFSG